MKDLTKRFACEDWRREGKERLSEQRKEKQEWRNSGRKAFTENDYCILMVLLHSQGKGGRALLKRGLQWRLHCYMSLLHGPQVLPSRTHPMNQMSGSCGYILAGMTIEKDQ